MAERILLGQLNSLGDCLLATPIARQIKHDFPGCHLVWAIGSMCRSVIENNPWVDEIWEISLEGIEGVSQTWISFEREALDRQAAGEFQHIFMTQISPANLHNYDGNIRGSIFRAYPHPVTVATTPVLRLSGVEVERARRFCSEHGLDGRRQAVLIESSPQSGQSRLNNEIALQIAEDLAREHPEALFVLTSAEKVVSTNPRVLDASVLTFRENAELANHCSLVVGGSSGISWLCTSDWVKDIPKVQWLDERAIWSNSMSLDFQTWGIPLEGLIEFGGDDPRVLRDCVHACLETGFSEARRRFHEPVKPNLRAFKTILGTLIGNGDWSGVRRLFQVYGKRPNQNRLQIAGALFQVITGMAHRRLRRHASAAVDS